VIHILKSSFWNLFGTAIIILSGAVLTLVAPKVLSIEDFGLWRTFLLYSTYAGILHLGIADGFLLNNVAVTRDEVFKSLNRSVPFLLIQQILISAIIFLVLYMFIPNLNMVVIGASVLLFSIAINMRTQFDNFLIITKNFKTSNIVKILDKSIFLIFLFSFLLLAKASYQGIIFFYILSSFLALIVLFIMVRPKMKFSKGMIRNNTQDIKVGSQLLASNVFIILLFNIDSMFVNMFLSLKSFAIFSFAITIIMLINQFAESISQVFFPYLATDLREKLFSVNQLISSSMFGLWVLILQFSYLFIPLINVVFPKYSASENIIVIYLLMSLFTLLIRISQNNMFKVLNAQISFVKIEVIVAVLVVITFLIARGNISLIAVSTVILITRMIWYILNELYLKNSLKFIGMITVGFILYSGIYLAIYFYVQPTYLKFVLFFICALPMYILSVRKLRVRRISPQS
jgi:O-antigen/teichoic acid export membrane protein